MIVNSKEGGNVIEDIHPAPVSTEDLVSVGAIVIET